MNSNIYSHLIFSHTTHGQPMSIDLLSPAGIDANRATITAPEIRIRGKVTKIAFSSEEDGYYIFSIARNGTGTQAKVKGYGFDLAIGREVDCAGDWEASKNPKYPDPTLKATSICEVVPASLEGIRKLLHSGFVKGIGKVTADLLLSRFGNKLFDIIETDPDQLYQLKGIGASRITGLINGINEKKVGPRLMAYLAEIGLGPSLSHRVFKKLGMNAVEKIKENPYVLTGVDLIGFAKADAVARAIGVDFDSPERIRAGLEAVLLKESDNGSTAVEMSRLIMQMSRLLTVNGKDVAQQKIEEIIASELHSQERVVSRDLAAGECVSLKEMALLEKSIAFHIARLVSSYRRQGASAASMSSERFAHLDPDQLAAARIAVQSGFSVITGRPGCGKTTTTKSIVDVMTDARMKVRLSAPTGRAAKKITEATGYTGLTNHRLLESQGSAGFKRNESNPLDLDELMMDETSMTDTLMMERTLRAMPNGAGMLLLGDVDQLASISAGYVLSDIINCGLVPVSVLTKIHRQAADSSIITNAHKIIDGIEPDNVVAPGKKSDFRLVSCADADNQVEVILEQFRALVKKGFAPKDIQILTPMRKNTDLGVNNLNKVLKNMLNPAEGKNSIKVGKFENEITFSEGDRVMQTANNNDLGIYNGDIGYIVRVNAKEGMVSVDFSGESFELMREDLADLDLAYATTIHKSQGSEFPAVIIPVSKGHGMMWDRNLLYTAVTRAKTDATLVGDTYMLKSIVRKTNSAKRVTGLQEEIKAVFAMIEQDDTPLRRKRAATAAAF
jgi:exodeoxyribonuclease V alpha subunit